MITLELIFISFVFITLKVASTIIEPCLLISIFIVLLNLFLVFVLNYLLYNFKRFCKNLFNFGLIFFCFILL